MNTTAITPTQAGMLAASLEIDARPDRAASSIVSGHISEFIYTGEGVPVSGKAKNLTEIENTLRGMIELLGMQNTIVALRAVAHTATGGQFK